MSNNEYLNDSWSSVECSKLRKWFEVLKARKKAHSYASYWNHILNRIIKLTIFLTSAIISTISLNIRSTPTWLLPTLCITNTIVILIQNIFSFEKNYECHKKTTSRFSSMIRKIEISLQEKENPKLKFNCFIDDIIETFNQVIKDAGPLPLYAKNFIKESNIEPPDPFE